MYIKWIRNDGSHQFFVVLLGVMSTLYAAWMREYLSLVRKDRRIDIMLFFVHNQSRHTHSENISYDKLALYSTGRVCTRGKTFPQLCYSLYISRAGRRTHKNISGAPRDRDTAFLYSILLI